LLSIGSINTPSFHNLLATNRFLVVGCLNFSVAYSIYFLLNVWLHYQVAYGAAYVCGMCFSYWLNSRWVFKEEMGWKSFLAFPLVYIIQYGISVVALYFFIEQYELSEWLAPPLAIILNVPITFLLVRYFLKK
jgi:putative flippase GtrA